MKSRGHDYAQKVHLMVFKKRPGRTGVYVWYKVSATDGVFKPVGGRLVLDFEGKLLQPPSFQCPRLPKISVLNSICDQDRLKIPNVRLKSHKAALPDWLGLRKRIAALEVLFC